MATIADTHAYAAPGRAGSPVELKDRYDNFIGGACLHVAPEAYAGGPLRAVQDGDPIVLDAAGRRLELDVPEPEVRRRLAALGPPAPRYTRGYGALYVDHVLQADSGCDLDFLRARPGEPAVSEPYGLLSGWVGGW